MLSVNLMYKAIIYSDVVPRRGDIEVNVAIENQKKIYGT